MNLFRTKSIAKLKEQVAQTALRKSLGAMDVALMGIGVIIGAGIFVLTGTAAATAAGPAIMLSFLLSSIACVFICLVYSELAAAVPASGSAYTFSYVGAGEFMAWLVGWALILEYSIGASAVAGGWSYYLVGLLKSGGIELPHALVNNPADGGIINAPASFIALFITFLLVRGVKESATANRILVAVKLSAIFLFILLAGPNIDPRNWEPFFPYGWAGVPAGAALIFFSYLGVDSLVTAAEETRNPQKDMPLGIIISLVVCTVLYIAVAAVMTGAVPYSQLNTGEPVSYVLRTIGYNFGSAIVGVGAVAGLTTVCLVMIYAQTRAFFAMSRDGLLPKKLCKVHPKYGTPYIVTIIVGCTVALIAGLTPINMVAEMCNVGTLFAFIVACSSAMILRKRQPHIDRPFRCPSLYLVASLAIISCLIIMQGLAGLTWMLFIGWVTVGIAIYFIYGRHNSVLAKGE
ncbi:amino acid permease [Microvirga sp. W0021]|uniref:Amino acid permease n=1 Tax=Hohaiivirga grylli TaxID=3133970 RepID=A0ABV0BLE7_9HYPH